ncbi:unnamed protein product, partial [Brassica rapa subsp. narinosa]
WNLSPLRPSISAPTAAPPGLAPLVLQRPPRPPTHRGLALAPTAGYSSRASAPSIFGDIHHLSSPDRHAHTQTLLRRSRSVGCAPVRDPANQLPCALRVYSPVDSHTCQNPWSVFQDGSNGEPTGRRPERPDAEARC